MSFLISPLSMTQFAPLFSLSDEELAARGAMRVTADRRPGFPCRVSLQDAEPGETVLLVNYEHLDVPTPFRSRHAVYVRQNAAEAQPVVGEVPEMLRSRTLSVRAWTRSGMLAAADLTEGTHLESLVESMLAQPDVDYLHVHFAKPGCYAARVQRASSASSTLPPRPFQSE